MVFKNLRSRGLVGGLEGFADFGEELGYFEGFEEDGLEAFLGGADNRVVGVVAEAGHEDDGRDVSLALGGREDVVAGLVGHAGVADHQVVVVLLELGDGFGAVVGDGDVDVVLAQDVRDRRAHVGLVVGEQDVGVGEQRVGFARDIVGTEDHVGAFGGLAHAAADRFGVVEDLLELVAQVVVADEVLHQRLGIGDD